MPDVPLVGKQQWTRIDQLVELGRILESVSAWRYWSPPLRRYFHVIPGDMPGNVPIAYSSNVRIVWMPINDDRPYVEVWEYGCAHDFEHSVGGQCYHRYVCRLCGFGYGVDSSG
jgi:hypothetical protein